MKNNLISAIAGWKSAALLALVAMVAAVAFSGVLTTEAQSSDYSAVEGETVEVVFSSSDLSAISPPPQTYNFSVSGLEDDGTTAATPIGDGTDTGQAAEDGSVTLEIEIPDDTAGSTYTVRLLDGATPLQVHKTIDVAAAVASVEIVGIADGDELLQGETGVQLTALVKNGLDEPAEGVQVTLAVVVVPDSAVPDTGTVVGEVDPTAPITTSAGDDATTIQVEADKGVAGFFTVTGTLTDATSGQITVTATAGNETPAVTHVITLTVVAELSTDTDTTTDPDPDTTPDPDAITSFPGGSATIAFETELSRFRIHEDSTASASFGANGRQTITCVDNSACDLDDDDGSIELRVNVDAGSAPGEIFVQNLERRDGEFQVAAEGTINVAGSVPVARVDAKAADKAVAAIGGSTTVTVTAYDSKGNKQSGKNVVFTSKGATLTGGGGTCEGGVLGCATKTDEDGAATVTVSGAGVPTTAVVTVTVGAIVKEVEIRLYGDPVTISAAADSVAGSALTASATDSGSWVIVTIADAAGNGVGDQQLGSTSADGPDASATAVAISNAERPAVPAAGILAAIPACSDGTDTNGQCAIKVDTTPTTTLGEHTLTIVGPEKIKVDDREVEVVVTVAGAAATLTVEAPTRVDYLSESSITVSLADEDGTPAGSTAVTVTQVSGNGAVLGTTDSKVNTVNGTATFKFLSANRADDVVILVRAGSLQETVAISVGPEPQPEPEPEPAPPTPVWGGPLASGTHNLVWHGDDGADPSEGALEGVTAIWQWNGSGWDGYFPAAADVPGGNTLDSLTNGAAYWVIVE